MTRFFIQGILFLLIIPSGSFAQELFEAAGSEVNTNKLPIELSGFGRGVFYLGEYAAPSSPEIKSAYGEAAFKINALSGSRGSLFTELRFRNG